MNYVRCVTASSEHDAVIAEQLQSADLVNHEHERRQIELQDEVSSFVGHIFTNCHSRTMSHTVPSETGLSLRLMHVCGTVSHQLYEHSASAIH